MIRAAFLAGLALATFATSPAARADELGPGKVPPQIHEFTVGSLRLTALRDASYTEANDGKSFGTNAGPDAVAKLLAAAGLPTDRVTLSVNALLVRTGKQVVLIDSGLGAAAGGGLLAGLKLAGVEPSQVTDVLVTHSHFDHVGGLANAQGVLAFPNAAIRMTAAEWDYLRGRKGHEQLVQAIGPRVATFVPGREILPGITPVALAGHTPGHVGYEIRSGDATLLDIGDLAHSSIISLAQPEWTVAYDSDAPVAERTRRETLTRLAATGQRIFAPHFPFPGVGRVAADGRGFKWLPASDAFDVEQIRAAERRVTAALTAPDVTAWVNEYTEDAVLLEPGSPPIAGRAALLELARTMKPIASGTISSEHIEGSGNVAYSYGTARWISGREPAATSTTHVRQILAWRREADGVWRIAMEAFLPLEPGK